VAVKEKINGDVASNSRSSAGAGKYAEYTASPLLIQHGPPLVSPGNFSKRDTFPSLDFDPARWLGELKLSKNRRSLPPGNFRPGRCETIANAFEEKFS